MNNLEFRYFDPVGRFFNYSSQFEWPDNFSKLEKFFSMASKFSEGIVQQYTGLTDSTGKKVFEGDIVCEKITEEMAANGESANISRVFFAAGTFMIDGDGPLYEHVYSLTPDRLEDYLVIGDIFQNPELLK